MKAHSHGQHGAHQGSPKISSHLVKGAAISTGAQTGKFFMSKITKHPLLLIGIGMAAGYLAHKYRKEIIGSVTNITDKRKTLKILLLKLKKVLTNNHFLLKVTPHLN